MSARQSIKLFISRELFWRRVWKLSAVFKAQIECLKFHEQFYNDEAQPSLLKHHQLFFNIVRIFNFNSLSPSLIHTLSASNLFYQFDSQPARFFSLLLATFAVFLLLLKALRKLAAPVRRRNQNILRCNWNFLVWVIKIRILWKFIPVSDMSCKRGASSEGLIWTERRANFCSARVWFSKKFRPRPCAAAKASTMNFTWNKIMFGFSLECTAQNVSPNGKCWGYDAAWILALN